MVMRVLCTELAGVTKFSSLKERTKQKVQRNTFHITTVSDFYLGNVVIHEKMLCKLEIKLPDNCFLFSSQRKRNAFKYGILLFVAHMCSAHSINTYSTGVVRALRPSY